MIGRLLEDAYFFGKFAWHYSQAPKRMNRPGFHQTEVPTVKARIKWAWLKTSNQI